MAQYAVHSTEETITHHVRGALIDPLHGQGVQVGEAQGFITHSKRKRGQSGG